MKNAKDAWWWLDEARECDNWWREHVPSYPGVSYQPKTSDGGMANLLKRECPACGAKIGEFCVRKGGAPITNVVGVHNPRFGVKKKRARAAFHWTK